MIHKQADGVCLISSHDYWLPGNYADEKAARYALSFPDATLARLQDEINHHERGNRPITTEDLRVARRQEVASKEAQPTRATQRAQV
jgi:hypothetical protein